METKGVLHDEKHSARLLKMTCDTLLFLKNDGTCVDMIVKTENNPYVNDQYTLLGKNIFTFFPEETVKELKAAVEHVVQTGEISNANYDLPSPEKRYFFKCIIQKFDDGHLLCQYRDITIRSQMKRRLEKANKRLTETGRQAKIGYWSYNTVTKMISYTGYVGVVWGVETEEIVLLAEYLEHVYPADRQKLVDVLERTTGEDTLEYRIVKDKVYYVKLKVIDVLRGKNGEAIVEGYTQNIDDIISGWDRLKMLSLALDNSNDSIFATKMDGTIIFANRFCRKMCPIAIGTDITAYKAYEVLEKFEDKEAWDNFTRELRDNDNALQYIWNAPNPGPEIISYDCSAFVFRNEYDEDLIWHLCRDVSERSRHEIELKKAKEKAEESDRLKSAFISNMSHEIRTPLNSIVGFSTIMAGIEKREERDQYLSIIESSNKRLLMLIDEVLDLSKIEAGIFELSYSNIELNGLCREVMVNYQFNTTFVPLRLELPDEDFYMQTDKNRLVQVISNLIDNALKFTKQGSVTLGYRAIPGFVEFSVEDTGIGIAPDKLTVIFDRFERVDHFIPGSGLGLSICKSIVERMGGDISVTSEVGVGSVFSFRIPLEDAREIEERYGKTSAFKPI